MLKIEEISLSYGNDTYSYDFTLEPGSFTALVGPSGGGKSTLVHIVAGFLPPQTGRIRLNGQDITEMDPGLRPLSVLFQDYNLFPHMTVFDNVAIGLAPDLKIQQTDRNRILEALFQVGLGDMELRKPEALSGGQRQRVAIARALVRNSPLILLDEPFSALDPGMRVEMLELVNQLRQNSDRIILMVSHQPTDMARFADRMIFLQKGRITADLSTDAFFAQNQDPDIQHYLHGRS